MMDLTDDQWNKIKGLISDSPKREDGRGRPPRPPRVILNGILWIMRTGAPWKDLPPRYPPYQTCHRRFQKWVREGALERLLLMLAKDLYERGGIDIRECYIDGSFVPAKKGAFLSALRNAEKAPRSWQLQTLLVFLSPLISKAPRRTK